MLFCFLFKPFQAALFPAVLPIVALFGLLGEPCFAGTDPAASSSAEGRSLRFLANVDPIDVKRALQL